MSVCRLQLGSSLNRFLEEFSCRSRDKQESEKFFELCFSSFFNMSPPDLDALHIPCRAALKAGQAPVPTGTCF